MYDDIWEMIQAVCAMISVIFAIIAFKQSKHADKVSQKVIREWGSIAPTTCLLNYERRERN